MKDQLFQKNLRTKILLLLTGAWRNWFKWSKIFWCKRAYTELRLWLNAESWGKKEWR